ncbi:hypothetical protein ACLOJK_010746 [Asimina triloba]
MGIQRAKRITMQGMSGVINRCLLIFPAPAPALAHFSIAFRTEETQKTVRERSVGDASIVLAPTVYRPQLDHGCRVTPFSGRLLGSSLYDTGATMTDEASSSILAHRLRFVKTSSFPEPPRNLVLSTPAQNFTPSFVTETRLFAQSEGGRGLWKKGNFDRAILLGQIREEEFMPDKFNFCILIFGLSKDGRS